MIDEPDFIPSIDIATKIVQLDCTNFTLLMSNKEMLSMLLGFYVSKLNFSNVIRIPKIHVINSI